MKTKRWLIAAVSLILIGLAAFAAAMTAYHWDFSRLSTDRLETNTYEIGEKFSGIEMDTGSADVLFTASDDGMCRVVCRDKETVRHSVSVREGVLTVRAEDEGKWYEHIGIFLHSPQITVYLPETEYDSLAVKGSTGSIGIPGEFRFKSVDLSLSTGDVNLGASVSGSVKIAVTTGDIGIGSVSAGTLELVTSTGSVALCDVTCTGDIKIGVETGGTKLCRVRCRNLLSNGSTGDISLKDVIAAEEITIERSTGDVVFESSDAAGILVETSTGSVTGSLLSEKVFTAETSTGRVSVPGTTAGEKCGIKTSTGDILIGIAG